MKKFEQAGSFVLVAAALTLLGGCDNLKGKDGNAGTTGATVSQADSENGPEAKYGAYTKAFNKLIDDVPWNLPKTYESMQKFNVNTLKASDEISYPETTSLLQRALEDLKAGRAIKSADAAAADGAADKLIAAGDILVAEWQALEPYFKARTYRDDNFAKAKAADPKVRAAYAAAMAGFKELDAALSAHQRARNTARMESFEKEGNMAGFHSVKAMLLADRFSTAVLSEDTAAAGQILPELTAEVEELRKAGAALPAGNDNKSEIETLTGHLSDSIGSFRDYQQSKKTDDLESVVKDYNEAVESSNDLEWKRT
jgi:hypothetical protein